MDAAGITCVTLWLGAWLRGAVGADDLLGEMARGAPDSPAVVSLDGQAPQPLSALLAAVRALPADRVWALLPRAGGTVGWPRDVPGEPGPAVLVSAVGGAGPRAAALLRPGRSGWRWDRCSGSSVPALEAAMVTARGGARALGDVATTSAQRLEALGLDRPPAGSLPHTWVRAMNHLPPGLPAPVQALLVRLAALHDALDLAVVEEGAAVTASESRSRSAELRSVLGAVDDIVVGVVAGVNAGAGAGESGA